MPVLARLLAPVFPMLVRHLLKILNAALQCIVQIGISALKKVKKKWLHRRHHHRGIRHPHTHASHPHHAKRG